MESVCFKKFQAPFAEFGQVAGIDAESLERLAPGFRRSRRHRRVDGAHVNVDGVEQQRRAVGIRVQPSLESDLLEMLRLTGARFDFRIVEISEKCLLPVMRDCADGGNVEAMSGFHV